MVRRGCRRRMPAMPPMGLPLLGGVLLPGSPLPALRGAVALPCSWVHCPAAPCCFPCQPSPLAARAVPAAGGSPITSYRLEMCCLGGVEGRRGDGGKGKAKVDPPFELAHLGPQTSAGGWLGRRGPLAARAS